MLEIEYKGGNTLVIATKKATIVTDPKQSLVGLKNYPMKDAIEVATEARFAVTAKEARLNIEGPGEYGIANFDIKGIAAQRHLDTAADPKSATIYRIEANEIRIALLGNIYEKLSEAQLEELGVVDILILPIGGNGYTLDATGATALVRSIDPKVVIPVHYADDALTYEVPQDTLETFVKELGAPVEETAKYKMKQANVIPATLTVVNVTRS
jgi:L-ascorbate metabolism protein UlaG (beta-lactamase superfamily)